MAAGLITQINGVPFGNVSITELTFDEDKYEQALQENVAVRFKSTLDYYDELPQEGEGRIPGDMYQIKYKGTSAEAGTATLNAEYVWNGDEWVELGPMIDLDKLTAILEYATSSAFPTTGNAGKIYIDKSTNVPYRWDGSTYAAIGSNLERAGGTINGDLTVTGTLTANKVYGAVWNNDYAEYFQRGGETDAGDIIALDVNATTEQYVRGTIGMPIVGVQSDSYGFVVGGREGLTRAESEEEFIPIGLAGRVWVNLVPGTRVSKGNYIGPSDVPGLGVVVTSKNDAVGIVVDNHITNNRVRIRVF